MAYNKDIPTPTDRISASQNDLLQNFLSVSTLIGIDHVNFDDPSGNEGKHNTVSMPNYVGGAASPVAVVDEIKLFTKDVAGVTQLFVLPETNAPAAFQAERNITGGTKATNGNTTLPSGIKLAWGQNSTAGASTQVIAFGGFFNAIYSVQVSISDIVGTNAQGVQDAVIRAYVVLPTGFSVVTYIVNGFSSGNRAPNRPFQWFAIGS